MKKLGLILLVLASNSFAEIVIENAWVRALPPTIKNTVAYMTIKNTGNKDLTIVQLKSKKFMMVQIHKTAVKDGVAQMNHHQVTVPANGLVELKPRSLHIMLMGRKSLVRKGGFLDMDIIWDDGTKTRIKATVK